MHATNHVITMIQDRMNIFELLDVLRKENLFVLAATLEDEFKLQTGLTSITDPSI